MKKRITKKRIFLIIFILIIGSFFISKKLTPKEEVINLESEKIEKRTIATSISTTGTIVPNSSKTLSSLLQGSQIKKVYVNEGDYVYKDDMICEFDVSAIEESLNTLKESKKELEEQKNTSKNTSKPNINLNEISSQIIELENEYNKSKENYEEKKKEYDNFNINDEEFNKISQEYNKRYEALSKAQSLYYEQLDIFNEASQNYNLYFEDKNQLNDNGEVIKKEDYKLKDFATQKHKDIYEEYIKEKEKLEELEDDMNEKDKKLSEYENTYNKALDDINNLSSKKENLEKETNSAKIDMEFKKTKLDLLKSSHENQKNTTNTINSMVDSLSNITDTTNQIDSTIKQLDSEIKTLESQIEKSIIKAPIDGVITSLSVSEGNIYMGNQIAKIEDNEGFCIEAFIDEYDIPDIKEGMEVLIKTDATRDEELTGEIFDIATTAYEGSTPSLGTSSNNATYKIKIKINTINDRLRLGMNARLSIVTNMVKDVITVPYISIHEENDKKYIEITKDNINTEKNYIETGIEGNYYVEVKSDNVKEGMKVVIPELEKDLSIDELINQMGSSGGLK